MRVDLPAKKILHPLNGAVTIAGRIAEGIFENGLTNSSYDEFGRLLDALSVMDEKLAKVVRRIKSSSKSIKAVSDELVAGNRDLSIRTDVTSEIR
ncbi:hypothetical protein PQQ87_36465 [Paraburkholderia nemoris]|uniref:hypothetical protein n=1 Tax=Paraburkholderia nemoris TaxID=2793076 RepID=UPI0038B77725